MTHPASPGALRVIARIKSLARSPQVATSPVAKAPVRWTQWAGVDEFCRTNLKVVDDRKVLRPFYLRPIQRAILAAEIRARRARKRPWFLVLKYRKGGVSTLEQALAYWTIWREPHQECVTLVHEPGSLRIIFRIVARFYDNQPVEYRHKKTAAQVHHIEFEGWDALYVAGVAGRTGAGRGATFSRVHLSEAAFYSALETVHTALSESIGPDSAYILETTPNGRDGAGKEFHEMWQAAKRGETDFIPLFFPWQSNPANAIALESPDEMFPLTAEEEHFQKLYHLTLEQVKWWRGVKRRLTATGGRGTLIHQEHPFDDESCFLYGGNTYFEDEQLQVAEEQCVTPVRVERAGRMRVFEADEARAANQKGYIIGGDPAGGGGKNNDDSAAVCYSLDTGHMAWAWTDPFLLPDAWGLELAAEGRRWTPHGRDTPAYLMVENNNHGHAVLTAVLRQASYPRDRVYHQKDDALVDRWGNPVSTERKPGWVHSTVGHADLTTAIGRQLRERSPRILDIETVRSIRRVSAGLHGAEFTGRDLAVANGLCVLGWHHAIEPTSYGWIGGQMVEL